MQHGAQLSLQTSALLPYTFELQVWYFNLFHQFASSPGTLPPARRRAGQIRRRL